MQKKMSTITKSLRSSWKGVLTAVAPIALAPIMLASADSQTQLAFRCAYVMALMSVFWVTEALPLAVTALLPVALLPLLGVMSTDEVSRLYLKEANMMFLSGMLMAIAVEESGLHRRLALKLMLAIGTEPRRLMLGFMVSTALLSMWLSNSATAAMMVPFVGAVVAEMQDEHHEHLNKLVDSSGSIPAKHTKESEYRTNVRHMLYLSVAYAANVGGTATLTGTGPNLVLKSALANLGPNQPINFASWMLYATPLMIINLLLCWLWLQFFFLGFSGKPQEHKISLKNQNERVQRTLKNKLRLLGRPSFHEIAVSALFLLLVFLWFSRDPKFVNGWADFVHIQREVYEMTGNSSYHSSDCLYEKRMTSVLAVDDATSGMLVCILLFVVPADPFSNTKSSLLTWPRVQTRMAWSLLLLLGGGFALAEAANISGLNLWLGSKLSILSVLSPSILALVLSLIAAAVTEVTSNVAVAAILLPVLSTLSVSLGLNPLYLMVPVTLSCSFAFMLPVATPPNAIAFDAANIDSFTMMKSGLGANAVCLLVNWAVLNIFGVHIFGSALNNNDLSAF